MIASRFVRLREVLLTLVESHGAVMRQEAIIVVTENRVRIRTGMNIDRNND